MSEYCPQSSGIEHCLSGVSETLYRAEQVIEMVDLAIGNGELCEWIEVVINDGTEKFKRETAKKILSLIEAGGGLNENVSRPFCLRIVYNEFLELKAECRQLVSDLLENISTTEDERHALGVFFPEIYKKISDIAELAA